MSLSVCATGTEEEQIALCAAHQQRLAAAVVLLLQDSGPAAVGPNQQPLGFDWEQHISRMSEADFKLRYRLSFDSFNKLLEQLQPKLDVANVRQAVNCRSRGFALLIVMSVNSVIRYCGVQREQTDKSYSFWLILAKI